MLIALSYRMSWPWITAFITLSAAALADPPDRAERGDERGNDSDGPRLPAGNSASPRPLPSAVVERLRKLAAERGLRGREHLGNARERARQREELRQRVSALSEEFNQSLRRANVDAGEVREKSERLAALRPERRRARRAALYARFGSALARSEVKEECKLHGQRMARLRRVQVVAATERSGAPRKALLGRIEKLILREAERHEQAMQKLIPTAPGVAPDPNAVPAPLSSIRTATGNPGAMPLPVPSGARP